jgi:hypothetical protein
MQTVFALHAVSLTATTLEMWFSCPLLSPMVFFSAFFGSYESILRRWYEYRLWICVFMIFYVLQWKF